MWKEEQEGDQRVNHARFSEAAATGADTLAVGCPFCLIMLSDAAKDTGSDIEVKDIAELIASNLDE
jgi:Fe-S oxidoreductase